MAARSRIVLAAALVAGVLATPPPLPWAHPSEGRAAAPQPTAMPTATAMATPTAAPAPDPPRATPRPPSPPLSPADAAESAAACAAASAAMGARDPDGGTVSGELTPGRPGDAALGAPLLAVDGDFVVTATFANPDPASGRPWDYGFALLEPGPAGRLRYAVAVDSLADVYGVVGDRYARIVGERCAFDPAPGARNTLQLTVLGDRAVLLVNGVPVAPFFLPTNATTGSLQAVAGLFVDDQVAGRTVLLEEASAWSLAE